MDQYKQVFVSEDKVKVTWTWDSSKFKRGPISVDIDYPKNFKDFEEEQEELPVTKRKYFDEQEGYYVGYQTAKKKGII